MEISPLSDAIGAEILGVDLSHGPEPATLQALTAALSAYKLLCLRGQDLDEDRQVRFSESLGRLQLHVLNQYRTAGHPAVFMISNLDADGRPNGEIPDPGACIWHSDGSYQRIPGRFTLLHGLEVPPEGGDTLFCNTELAWEELDPVLQQRLRQLTTVHDLDWSRRRSGARGQMTEEQRRAAPPTPQPMARRDPDTGRTSLYVDGHTARVEGLDEAAGRKLIDSLIERASQPQRTYRHHWLPGDLLLWDNRGTMHRATPFDAARHRRRIRRTTTVDAHPVLPVSA